VRRFDPVAWSRFDDDSDIKSNTKNFSLAII
jgi:hypothetical protein